MKGEREKREVVGRGRKKGKEKGEGMMVEEERKEGGSRVEWSRLEWSRCDKRRDGIRQK